jgi:hypothetical protein
VVIDKLTKFGHFIPLKHPFTAASIAQLFMDNVYKLHGMPQVIISDRDKVFVSSFWQRLFKLADTTLNLSSSYHPQTDGQTERLNQCLETYLRCLVHAKPEKWSQWLPQAEFWYNTTFHSALGKSPFEVLYGRAPRQFAIQNSSLPGHTDVEAWLRERAAMATLIKQHLQHAQQRMKNQEDKNRTEREFAVGDMVYMKLQPYAQTSVARRSNHKLAFKFFGPYEVLSRVGKVAYKLKLPANSQIHPVLHVSQLKKSVPPAQVHSLDFPLHFITDEKVGVQPTHIHDRREIKHGRGYIKQALVEWSGLPSTLRTWEPEVELRRHFPLAAAWGQAALQGEETATVPGTRRHRQRDIRRALGRQEKAEAQNTAQGGNGRTT